MNRKDFKFEICANSVESCLAAQEGGADRVELCAGIPEGGTTPSYGEIKVARKLLTRTKLHVIIRPRGGDFLYTPLELERMEEDIRLCRELGVDGVVIGCLTEEGEVDMEANRRLIDVAKGAAYAHEISVNTDNAEDIQELRPMSVTFHRAFDRTANPMKALEDIIALGCDRILTSGQQPKAIDGTDLLAKLEEKIKEIDRKNAQKQGEKQGEKLKKEEKQKETEEQPHTTKTIQILAGSGVNEDNIRQIFEKTGIHEYHFSARINVPSRMKNYNHEVYMGAKGADEANSLVTSAKRVKDTIAKLTDSF